MLKSRIGRIARVVGTVCLIVLVCYQAGFFSGEGLDRFSGLWRTVDWTWITVSVGVALVQNFVSVFKWRVVVMAKRLRGTVYELLQFLYIGRLYNLILPTSMGGDVMRFYRLGKINNNMERAAASVFVDRFTGMIVLLVFAALSLMISFRGSDRLFVVSLFFVLGMVVVLGWAAVDYRIAGIMERLGEKLNYQLLTKISTKFGAFQTSIRDLRGNRSFFAGITFFSLLFYCFAVANVWTSALAFDWNVRLMDMVIAVPIIMLVMNLPVSIGGLGLMEASYTVGFQLLGYSAELGLTTALLMRAKTLLDALIGGAFELRASVK